MLSEATPQKKKPIEIDITNSDTIPGDVGSLGSPVDKSAVSPVARSKGRDANQSSPVASTASLPSSYGSNASVCWLKLQLYILTLMFFMGIQPVSKKTTICFFINLNSDF